jgi:hypothetical protein
VGHGTGITLAEWCFQTPWGRRNCASSRRPQSETGGDGGDVARRARRPLTLAGRRACDRSTLRTPRVAPRRCRARLAGPRLRKISIVTTERTKAALLELVDADRPPPLGKSGPLRLRFPPGARPCACGRRRVAPVSVTAIADVSARQITMAPSRTSCPSCWVAAASARVRGVGHLAC